MFDVLLEQTVQGLFEQRVGVVALDEIPTPAQLPAASRCEAARLS
ncbi:MAG: hypothetical protein QM778_29005 [Myxococcales bacterium]